MKKERFLFILICAIAVIVSSCGKKSASIVGISDTNEMKKYHKQTTVYSIPDDTDVFNLLYSDKDNCLVGICGIDEKYIAKMFRSGEKESETLYKTDAYILGMDCTDDDILICNYDGEDKISLLRLAGNEEKELLTISRKEVGLYPSDVCTYNDKGYLLISSEAIYIVNEGGGISHKIKCEKGNIVDCAVLADNRIAVITCLDNVNFFLSIVSENDRAIANTHELSFSATYCTVQSNKLMLTDGQLLYEYDIESNNAKQIFDFREQGISAQNFREVYVKDDEIKVVSADFGGGEAKIYCFSERDENSTEEEKQKVYLYSPLIRFSDIEPELIGEFNDINDKYEVIEIDNDMSIEAVFTSNDHPDILFETYGGNIEKYVNHGYLDDLWPLFDNSDNTSRDDVDDTICSLFEKNGKLYAIPRGYSIDSILIPESEKDFEGEWSVYEFLEWLEKHKKVRSFDGIDKQRILSCCVKGVYKDFVNEDNRTANFDSDEFADIMRRVSELELDEISKEGYNYTEETVNAEEKPCLIMIQYPSSLFDLFYVEGAFKEKLVSVGYPGIKKESTVYLHSNGDMGVFADCKCKEGAYAFIEYYLLASAKKSFHAGFFTNRMGDFWSLNSIRQEGYELAKEVQKDDVTYPGIEFCATDEDIELVDKLIDEAVFMGSMEFAITRLICEEYATVENGTATVEQACKVIQSRVSIMLAETE